MHIMPTRKSTLPKLSFHLFFKFPNICYWGWFRKLWNIHGTKLPRLRKEWLFLFCNFISKYVTNWIANIFQPKCIRNVFNMKNTPCSTSDLNASPLISIESIETEKEKEGVGHWQGLWNQDTRNGHGKATDFHDGCKTHMGTHYSVHLSFSP